MVMYKTQRRALDIFEKSASNFAKKLSIHENVHQGTAFDIP